MLQVDQLREENEALRAKAAEAAAAASAERPAAVEAVERVREVVVVKEDEEGKARADAARKEVEEVGKASIVHVAIICRYIRPGMSVQTDLPERAYQDCCSPSCSFNQAKISPKQYVYCGMACS